MKKYTYLEAIALAVQEILETNPKAYVLGEDVAPPYGNAFMLFKSMPKELWPQFINTPISEVLEVIARLEAERIDVLLDSGVAPAAINWTYASLNIRAKLHESTV